MDFFVQREAVFLCVDIGTSSLKAAYITSSGMEIARTTASYRRHGDRTEKETPGNPRKADYRRHSGDWEEALYYAMRRLEKDASDVMPSAVCISGNGPTLIPVTADGIDLAPLQWFEQTAPGAGKSLFLPRVTRFAAENGSDWERTARIFSCPEWLSWKLGAAPYTCLPAPDYEPFYWDEAQCAAASLDSAKFPPFVPLGSIAGAVSESAAKKYALPEGIPIVAGGPDFVMAILGVAAVREGAVCDRAGTSEGINVCFPSARKFTIPDELRGKMRCLPHPVAGFSNISYLISESGSLFDRYREENGLSSRGYDEMVNSILDFEENAARKNDDIYREKGRAVLENIAVQVKNALAALASCGFPVKTMTISGRQATNSRWNRFKAAITGCILQIPRIKDGELAGDAAAALFATGGAASLEDAAHRIVQINETIAPGL